MIKCDSVTYQIMALTDHMCISVTSVESMSISIILFLKNVFPVRSAVKKDIVRTLGILDAA